MIKRPWTIYEDNLLRILVNENGPNDWSFISTYFADRSAKACRARWCDQLSPELNHLPITLEEHLAIAQAHAEIGNCWAEIATRLNGRTANRVKNHWKSDLRWKYSDLIMQNEEDQFRANREAVPGPRGPALNNPTWLSLGMPGLGFEDAPVAEPIMRSPEPVSLELSLSVLGQGDGGIRAEEPVVKEINFFV
ncbi:transcription factor MYB44-like [Bidens hawaiensis]|uniref:transcription factor MYB44-like n=1 Tax=Bidens hawaiensis TaxID=980011 RepID=UPI00404A11BA